MGFDENLKGLVDTCLNVFKAENNSTLSVLNDIKANNENIVLKYLNNYKKSFDHGDISKHKPFILSLYLRFKDTLIKNKDDFSWLENDSVILIFGEFPHDQNKDKRSKNIRILLSSIYRKAISLKDRVESELDGLPDSAYENRNELIYPDIIVMYLLRLFLEVSSEQEKPIIESLLRDVEISLGKSPDSYPDTTPNSFSGILGCATNMVKRMGINIPDGAKLPSETEITSMMNGIMQNPATGELLSNIFKGIDGGNGGQPNIGGLFNNIMENFRDGKLAKVIQETLPITASQLNETKESSNSSSNSGSMVANLKSDSSLIDSITPMQSIAYSELPSEDSDIIIKDN